MALSDDDRRLIVEALRWARANGWTRMKSGRWRKGSLRFDYTLPVHAPELAWLKVYRVGTVKQRLPNGYASVATVAQAVDVLAGLGVLPFDKSAMYDAGYVDGIQGLAELAIDERVDMELDQIWERLQTNDARRTIADAIGEVGQLLRDGDPWVSREAADRVVEAVLSVLNVPKAVADEPV